MSIIRIACGIAYHGAAGYGWQAQPGLPTIQSLLTQAISTVAGESQGHEPNGSSRSISVVGAGRTDRGVHALGQVAHFDTQRERSPATWCAGINAHLPSSIRVQWAQVVPEHFHARFSALRRHYSYYVLNTPVSSPFMTSLMAWRSRALQVELMHQAAQLFKGRQDFSAVRGGDCQAKSPIKTVESVSVTRQDDTVVLDICADGFLHHMVRNIMGLLLRVGEGRLSLSEVARIVASKDRGQAGKMAEARGLYLRRVDYDASFGLPEQKRQMVKDLI